MKALILEQIVNHKDAHWQCLQLCAQCSLGRSSLAAVRGSDCAHGALYSTGATGLVQATSLLVLARSSSSSCGGDVWQRGPRQHLPRINVDQHYGTWFWCSWVLVLVLMFLFSTGWKFQAREWSTTIWAGARPQATDNTRPPSTSPTDSTRGDSTDPNVWPATSSHGSWHRTITVRRIRDQVQYALWRRKQTIACDPNLDKENI